MRIGLLFSFIFLLNFVKAQEKSFPYQLNSSDYILFSLGLATESLAWYLEKNTTSVTYNELLMLNRQNINFFDRNAIYKWNTTYDKISDFSKWGLAVSPCALLIPTIKNKEWKSTLTYGVMYFEVALLTTGFTDLTKILTQRERPYLYNSQLNIQQKQEYIDVGDDRDSFFSGHTSIAFASAVFLSKTVSDIYGKGTLSKVVWVSCLTAASVTAYLRYESGQHYPTDIIAGALMGSAIGYLIPTVHKKNGKLKDLSFVAVPNYFTIAYRF